MKPTPPSSLLQQRINPLSGESEWVLVTSQEEEEEEEEKVDGIQNTMANTSYLDMLNDRERNQAYEAAIKMAMRSSPCRILDIGAGTGLLSMMAARALQEAVSPCTHYAHDKPVIACEAFLPMFRLACKVLQSNGYSSFVHLVHKRSEDMEMGIDMVSPADILVTEILDSALLGEGLIPTLQHAYDHLLKPNALVIPHKATIFGQLVQCDYLWRLHDLYSVESQIADGLALHPPILQQSSFLKPLQYAMHVDALMDKIEMISHPFKVFEFDLSKRPASYGKMEVAVKVTRMGLIHAIISWWVLQLDEEGLVFYSTAPKWIKQTCSSWHDHWKQCVWFVPGQGLDVVKDEDLSITALHDEISFKYDIGFTKNLSDSSSDHTTNHQNLRWAMRPERIGLLGSCKWRSTVMAAMKKALYGSSSSLCLVVDDSLPLTISAAATSTTTMVVSLLPSLQCIGSEVLKSMLEANGLASDRVKVVGKKANELNIGDIGGRKVDVLVGEPYYQACEDMLPWRNLRFWKERTCLATLLSESVVTVPCRGILCGMAMSMHDLWNSRQSLKSVQGFDHSLVNEGFGACGDLPLPLEGPILPYYLWQCGEYQELTEPFSIMTFDFLKAIETVKSSKKVQISKTGTCHGIVLWIDWVMDRETEERVYTGPEGHDPTHWKQGVKLLRSPMQVVGCQSKGESCNFSMLDLSATFDSESGDLLVSVDLL